MIEYDEIGKVLAEEPVFGADGSLAKAGVYAKGWHVNTPVKVEELSAYEIIPAPKSPQRIYDGVETTFLRFANKQAFDDVIAALEAEGETEEEPEEE